MQHSFCWGECEDPVPTPGIDSIKFNRTLWLRLVIYIWLYLILLAWVWVCCCWTCLVCLHLSYHSVSLTCSHMLFVIVTVDYWLAWWCHLLMTSSWVGIWLLSHQAGWWVQLCVHHAGLSLVLSQWHVTSLHAQWLLKPESWLGA